MTKKSSNKAPRNRTLSLSNEDREALLQKLQRDLKSVEGIINGDTFDLSKKLPKNCIDLLILDPPYNLTKTFGKESFSSRSTADYQDWIESYLEIITPALKSTATIYVCGDWLSSASLYPVLNKFFKIRNRITWEREKGRASKTNWKNCSEDIWYCTMGDNFKFFQKEFVCGVKCWHLTKTQQESQKTGLIRVIKNFEIPHLLIYGQTLQSFLVHA